MPICKKCSKKFPYRVVINGKHILLHHRTYCLDCNPFGQRKIWNGKLTNRALYGKSKRSMNYKERICKTCGNKFSYRSTNCECTNCRNKKTRNYRKNKIVEIMGGRCMICGYNKNNKALGFHHIEKDDKKFTISDNLSKSIAEIKKELKKCMLVCSNCHIEIHDNVEILNNFALPEFDFSSL